MALTTLSYKTDADVVKTEGPNRISRDEGILASGTAANVSIPGLVVGKIAVGGATPAAKSGGNTGNGVLTMDGTTPVLSGAKAGVYQVRLITAASNGGTFRVTECVREPRYGRPKAWDFFTDHKDSLPSDPSFLETAKGYLGHVPISLWIALAGCGFAFVAYNAFSGMKKITSSVQSGARQ